MPNSLEAMLGRVLVTGATGFLGRVLLPLLADEWEVHALTREPKRGDRDLVANLLDPDGLREAVQRLQPDAVVHLAGQTPPATTSAFYQTNTLGTAFLLEALKGLNRRVRMVAVGSAAELGPVDETDLPVNEAYPARPADAYGASKLLATTACLAARAPLEVMVARVFNPIGPGLPESQAFGRFARLLADASEETLDLTVGDLSPRRDFVDVRDVARALTLLLKHGVSGALYHVGTGESHSIQSGLDELIRRSGKRVRTQFDPELARRTGPRDSRANIARLRNATGWRPEIPWEQSLADLWAEAADRRCRND